MATHTHTDEQGYIEVEGGKVWYRFVNQSERTCQNVLVVLHGGPGVPSSYLDTLWKLSTSRPVLMYDQLGCGRSERSTNLQLWHAERFVSELAQVLSHLRVQRYYLLGQSWGGSLALLWWHALHTGSVVWPKPLGIILASPLISVHAWCKDADMQKAALPQQLREELTYYEAKGEWYCERYQELTKEVYRRHLCRLPEWPICLTTAQQPDMFGHEVYETMWGPNEFTMNGNLKDLDLFRVLPTITVPTLITCGRYDEATPETMQRAEAMLPDSSLLLVTLPLTNGVSSPAHSSRSASALRIYENSSHTAHLEQEEQYLVDLQQWLDAADESLSKQNSGI